jgi:hypothetical protein
MESLLRRVAPRLAAFERLAATEGDAAPGERVAVEPDLLASADLMVALLAGGWTGE